MGKSAWKDWGAWVLANSVGASLGLGLVWAAMRFADKWAADEMSSFGGLLTRLSESGLIFAIVGVVGGSMQWLALRRMHLQVHRWVMFSTIGFAGGIFALGAVFNLSVSVLRREATAGLIVAALVGGAIVGAAQWLVLRREVSRAAWWPAATAVGLVVGVTVFLVSTRSTDTGLPGIASGGALGGATYGAISGVVLILLMRSRTTE